MSVFLSYSPSTAPSSVVALVILGSNAICPSCSFNTVVDKMSLLTITPVSFKPLAFKILRSSLANLLVRPSSIASAKFMVCSSSCLGGV